MPPHSRLSPQHWESPSRPPRRLPPANLCQAVSLLSQEGPGPGMQDEPDHQALTPLGGLRAPAGERAGAQAGGSVLGFPHLEPYFVRFKGITGRSSLFLPLSLCMSSSFFLSSFCSSEDLKGPETKPQLVRHEYQAHVSAFPCLKLSVTESISTLVHLPRAALPAIPGMQILA